MLRRALQIPRWTRHAGTAVFVGGTVLLLSSPAQSKKKVQNDASNDPRFFVLEREHATRAVISDHELLEKLPAYVWGTNLPSFLPASTASFNAPRIPTPAVFSGRALRDLVIHETHSALVDASGDVYRLDPLSSESPKCILKGKDIRNIAASSSNIYALSSSGRIYYIDDLPPDFNVNGHSGSWLSLLWPGPERNVLATSVGLSRRETFTSISAGRHHLLAVTSTGRTFALPTSLDANSHGQLGTRKVQALNKMSPSDSSNTTPRQSTIELVPESQLDPFANASPFARASGNSEEHPESRQLVPLLYEIPSLRGIPITKAVASDRSSYVLTKEGGRVLAWGANEYGQLGLGAAVNVPAVSVPAEVNFSRNYTGNFVKCTDIAAGGNITYFIVESVGASGGVPSIDVFACGMGQYGALGNGTYVQAQGTPVKMKALSGNFMFNEQTNRTEAIQPQTFSVSPTGHALASLSSGRDLLTWGANGSFQLGNGKRASIAVPTYMRDFSLVTSGAPDTVDLATDRQGRMTLRSGTIKELKNMSGRKVATNVTVQQWPVAGWNASALYWRIIP